MYLNKYPLIFNSVIKTRNVKIEYGERYSHTTKNQTENWKQIFSERNCAATVPISTIHMYVYDLYIPPIDLPILLWEICGPILGIINAHRHMNVEIGTEAAQFP
jgi:hypothetical protein